MDALLSPPADRKLAIVAQGSASEVRQREVSWFAAVAEMTYQSASPLKTRPPLPGAPPLQKVKLPAPLPIRGDIVELLLEERQGDR